MEANTHRSSPHISSRDCKLASVSERLPLSLARLHIVFDLRHIWYFSTTECAVMVVIDFCVSHSRCGERLERTCPAAYVRSPHIMPSTWARNQPCCITMRSTTYMRAASRSLNLRRVAYQNPSGLSSIRLSVIRQMTQHTTRPIKLAAQAGSSYPRFFMLATKLPHSTLAMSIPSLIQRSIAQRSADSVVSQGPA